MILMVKELQQSPLGNLVSEDKGEEIRGNKSNKQFDNMTETTNLNIYKDTERGSSSSAT